MNVVVLKFQTSFVFNVYTCITTCLFFLFDTYVRLDWVTEILLKTLNYPALIQI